ncbi:MAG: hypothetical protein IKE18_06335 [Oscillospiraceae bacterium]|nr:hypothetical protein [Oscillospiraceae bacterium]
MPRLTNIVKDRRTMLTETRMQPAPSYDKSILNSATLTYTAKRDEEFMYREMLLRLKNHLKTKLTSDQISVLHIGLPQKKHRYTGAFFISVYSFSEIVYVAIYSMSGE